MVAAVEHSGSGSSSVGNECEVAVPRLQVVGSRGAVLLQSFGSVCSLRLAAKLNLSGSQSFGVSPCNSNLPHSLGLASSAGCGPWQQGVLSGLLARGLVHAFQQRSRHHLRRPSSAPSGAGHTQPVAAADVLAFGEYSLAIARRG